MCDLPSGAVAMQNNAYSPGVTSAALFSLADRMFFRDPAGVVKADALRALLVAAVGAYSVISYSVSQRTHEIGVRMALGARSPQVARLVMGESMRAIGVGITLGIAATLAMGRLVASLLYHTSPRDPVVLLAVVVVLVSAALTASIIPTWRATRTDPAIVLRAE